MGLLKRLFSLGSKKNKKQRPDTQHNVPLPERPTLMPIEDAEHEAAMGRLLRSSSTRFIEQHNVNYNALTPLPHPINNVIQPPSSSSVSIASSTISQRPTYNVTVHKRKRHASTEFPYANRGFDEDKRAKRKSTLEPNEDSRVLRLRSDPSVVSLMELYDEHGKLSSDAFSNSPPHVTAPKEERAQCRRSGSTLRQLLGAPALNSASNDSSMEGDISWAERFLGEIGDETGDESARSSMSIQTPRNPSVQDHIDLSFTSVEMSSIEPDNPAVSSMEVELSMGTDLSHDLTEIKPQYPPPATPQRASEVFDFLTRGKQSKTVEDVEKTLPDPPSAFSSPSDENASSNDQSWNETDIHTIPAVTRHSRAPVSTPLQPSSSIYEIQRNNIPPEQQKPMAHEHKSPFSDDTHDIRAVVPTPAVIEATPHTTRTAQQDREVHVLMTGPTKVILTTATPMADEHRIRGPRALPRKRTRDGQRRRPALGELSNSRPSNSNATPKSGHPQSSSQRSSSRHSYDGARDGTERSSSTPTVTKAPRKENQLGLSVTSDLPSTPLRSHSTGSQALLKSVVQHSLFDAHSSTVPSPASSSEMSPAGRQMMVDVRQQRMKARERARERSVRRGIAERV